MRTGSQPDWLTERAALGEAPGVTCPPEARAAIEASNAAILAALPPAMVAAEVDRRYQRLRRARTTRRRMTFAIATATAAAIAVVVFVALGALGRPTGPLLAIAPEAGGEDTSQSGEVTRIKGDPRLVVHRKHGEAIERLADGARAARGDVIQLSYVAAGRRFGAIVSVDGRGAVTVHLPAGGDRAAELGQGGAIPLADAYELDDAPGFERFILVTCAERFELDVVHRAAAHIAGTATARTRRLDLPASLAQHSFLLRKDAAP